MPASHRHPAPDCGGAGFGRGSSCGSGSSALGRLKPTGARGLLRPRGRALFCSPTEPQLQPALAVLGLALAGSVGLFFWRRWARWLGLLPMLTIAGFACTVWQAHQLGDHLLDQTLAGDAVTARIEQIVYRPDGPRFLLTDIQGEDPALAGLRRAQIKWRGNGNGDDPIPAGAAGSLAADVPACTATGHPRLAFSAAGLLSCLSAYGYSLGDPVVTESVGHRGSRPSARPCASVSAGTWRAMQRASRYRAGGGLRGDLSEQTRPRSATPASRTCWPYPGCTSAWSAARCSLSCGCWRRWSRASSAAQPPVGGAGGDPRGTGGRP